MKFRLLRCLLFAFACVVGFFEAYGEDCEPGMYLDGVTGCFPCPTPASIDTELFKYIKYGDDNYSTCALQLDTEKSKCDTGTNVIYRTNNGSTYTRVSDTVIPDAGYYKLDGIGEHELVDHCGTCDFANGYYKYTNTTTNLGTNVQTKIDVCKKCPLEGTNAERAVKTGMYALTSLYRFMQGDDNTKCYIKLQPRVRSKCNTGTNVIYTYDASDNNYKYVSDDNYVVIPTGGYFILDDIDSTDVVDHCGDCDIGNGFYTDNGVCKKCPLANTNAEGKVGVGKRFQFVEYDTGLGEGEGIGSCAVKLDTTEEENCSSATNVVYTYIATMGDYVRTVSNVFANPDSVIAADFPDNTNMTKEFCTLCPENEPYNVGGKCGACEEKGYYLKPLSNDNNHQFDVAQQVDSNVSGIEGSNGESVVTSQNQENSGESTSKSACVLCPAGYYCPGRTADPNTSQKAIICPKNTYSEDGASSCTSCASGYTTALSGPVGAGFDGLCLRIENGFGVQCISPNACKLSRSVLKVGDVSFSFGDNIKIESLNKSVIKSISGTNQ